MNDEFPSSEQRRREAEARLDALLLEGLHSGDPIEGTPEFWKEQQRRLIERWRGHKPASGNA